jgi:hypothetical protein
MLRNTGPLECDFRFDRSANPPGRTREKGGAVVHPLLLACLLVSLGASPCAAQSSWQRIYGGPDDDYAYSVRRTGDGNYIVGGGTSSYGHGQSDFYLLKITSTGETLWTRTYGGDSSEYVPCVRQTADNGFVMVGTTNSFGPPRSNAWLVKADANGDTQWTRTYGGSSWDYGETVRQTFDGGYIIAGSTWSWGAGRTDAWLVKTDAAGDTQWTRVYGGSEYEGFWDILQTSDSGYVCSGFTNTYGHGGPDVWLVKTNASGDTQWTRTIGGSDFDEGYSIGQTADGGYIVLGATISFGAGFYDFYLIRTDAQGETLWTRTYGGDNDDEGFGVQQTRDGGFILVGQTRTFGLGNFDAWLIKTDASGDSLWAHTFGDTAADWCNSVEQTPDDGYIIAGQDGSIQWPFSQVYVVKTDVNGHIGIGESHDSRPARPVVQVLPNPFVAHTALRGHTRERVAVLDASGRQVGDFDADRIGDGLAPGVYFLRLTDGGAPAVPVVKLRE